MKIGVIYPQTTMQTDPGAIHHWTQAVESLGFSYVLAYDHVVGANRASRPGQNFPYDFSSTFHDPFVLFAFMAARTSRLGFATGVLVVTQRQATLVAKQAACVDVLSQGRLRLGVGTGWNQVEYEALGMDFASRGKRIEEQIAVMRRLWTEQTFSFQGDYHRITDAGLAPLPIQRPIPVWLGGGSDRAVFGEKANLNVIRRIARIADGWIQLPMPLERSKELIEIMSEYCREYGRDPKEVGIEVRLALTDSTRCDWISTLEGWRDLGISHLAVNTAVEGLEGVDAHIERLALFHQDFGRLMS